MTQSDVQTFLSTILGVDASLIVPKQGNWYNPQDRIPSPDKPDTWIAFLMTTSTSSTLQYYLPGDDNVPMSTVQYVSKVDLQIVGTQAEALVQSIAHWLKRDDVMAELDSLNAQLMAQDLGSYVVTQFDQEGLNSVLAYNTSFYLQWTSFIQSNQIAITSVNLGGLING